MSSIQRATEILCDAFVADPVVEWVFPGPVEQRRAGAARVFAPLVAASAEAGELAVLDDGAAAVWLPVVAGESLAPGPGAELPPRLRVLVDTLARNHSTEREHLYLAFIGVAREKQGQGLGGRLLEERLRSVDVPVYLEASAERNVALYARHGFRLTGDPVTLPDGPTVWPMWRES
ncbi:GNAT family N-acetyltransferase [Allokutzneria multivorans]|uniref:GNAT family N-acetyltransferase n=1 Tax=Allokutzneria multivorans TaxID=1142134 RepID=A0ABP7S046_9PSEU